MCDFVHLHNHSEYSLLDGASRIRDMTARAKQLGMKALALTDHGVMYGAVPFYKSCLEQGLKPIIGMEAYVTAGSLHERASRRDQPIYHLTLLAKNEAGYRNLMKLSSIGHLEGFHYRPRIDFDALSAHAEGLICLSGCMSSELSQLLFNGKDEEARALALKYRGLFGEDYFLELQDHGILEQKRIAAGILQIADETGIPLAATNDAHYLCEDDYALQDVLICIGTGKTLDDPDRLKIDTNQLYLKSGEDMKALFRHRPEAVANTVLIAERCDLKLEFGRHILPRFSPLPEGSTAGSYLAELCRRGLSERFELPGEEADAEFMKLARSRLDYELDVIGRMGFDDYFLIVWDFIRFAHEQGIATGPGRGSSAGSLVAYVLKITDVDPLRHKLLFERFLNPERISMPDIDIDFSDERRDEVIRYVVDKYGKAHVAQIITFGTLAARAAVRDVGRVMNVPFGEVDKAAKLIPGMPGMSIDRAMKESAEFRAIEEKGGAAGDLIAMARRAEGMPRHASTHAAGVVISSDPLTDYVPLQEGSADVPLTQYAMEHLEAIGLLKMDFLGLRTLSIIERAQASVLEATGGQVKWQTVSYDDPQTYALLGKGDTTGIFQLESTGMRRVLREMKPQGFEDIVSVLALYRPGPMEFIPQFIKAMHGEAEVHYPHPVLEPILKDTYGIIVYQEQIMQIASMMAGFSLGEADLLRRAVSKKKREVLDEQRAHFVQGSLGQGYLEEEANRVYDMIVRFADYGFPRAHAAAYAVLAFQTAYLKAHHPVAFMSSMLTSVIGNQRKTAEYVDECRRMGIAVLPPDVNESGVLFTPVRRSLEENSASGKLGAIRFGLAAVKNVGTQAIDSLMKERLDHPFDSLADVCRRVDPRACNKRVLESLLLCGAMDSLPGHRAQQLAALDESVEAAAIWRKEKEELQLELFDLGESANWEVDMPDVTPYTSTQMLEQERELLGLYLSGHPLDAYDELAESAQLDRLVDLADAQDGRTVVIAGMVVSVKSIVTKSGQAMAFLELEDRIMGVEVVVFPSVWKTASSIAGKGSLLLVRAKLQQGDEDFKLLADEIVPLSVPDALQRAERMRRAPGRGPYGAASREAGPSARPQSGAPSREAGLSARPQSGAPSREAGPSARPQSGAASRETAPSARLQSGAPSREPAQASAAARSSASPAAPSKLASRASSAVKSPGSADAKRVYIRIGAEQEAPDILKRLQRMLAAHSGPYPTVLFYEREHRSVALSESYRVLPSPTLVETIERLLGAGSVKVK